MALKAVPDCSCLGSGMPMATVILTASRFAHCRSREQAITSLVSWRDQKLTVMTQTPMCNPGATEVCDGVDNNCDGQIDEDVKITFYRDLDDDGYGNTEVSTLACSAPAGYVAKSGDCDDSNAAVHPGAQEVCDDGIDNNCDGIVDNCTNPPATVWKPRPGTSWQWQLTGTIDTSFDVDMYDIDLFDSSASLIEQLHNDGRIVICYFSAGSWEDWRPDADNYPPSVKGKALEGWPDEKWLDIRNIDVLGPLIDARLDMAVSKGCDGVEPDNVDAYTNDSGFPLTANDQLQFNRWLAAARPCPRTVGWSEK